MNNSKQAKDNMGFYKPLTPEEKRIDKAIDASTQAKRDEQIVGISMLVCYLLALGFYIAGANSGGDILLGGAVVLILAHIGFSYRAGKKKHYAKLMVNDYRRKNATPFYYELIEKFAKEPNLQLRLEQNGSITVIDKRKNKNKE